MSLPNWVRKERRVAFSRAGNEAKARLRIERGVDADTLRHRSLDDARGQVLREGTSYKAGSVTPWQIRRSVDGKVDQLDIVVAGRVWKTTGPRQVSKLFGGWRTAISLP